jgi:hypothetical protein
MKGKRSYAANDVEQLDVPALVQRVEVGVIVAIDVAKTKFVAAIATDAGDVVKLVKFEHPRQTAAFLGLLRALQQAERKPVVVMEPTGTYGDALRYQCHALGLSVHMMPPKHSHDFAEVLDGVPSMHDPKAATVLAKLQAIKPARAWEPQSETRRDLRAWVDQRHPIARVLAIYQGHLEAMLVRHWPEFGDHFDGYEQRSWFALLKEFPGPQAVTGASEAAGQTLRKARRGQLGPARVRALIGSAKSTTGVPMTGGEQERLRVIAEPIELQTHRLDAVDAKLTELVAEDAVLTRMACCRGSRVCSSHRITRRLTARLPECSRSRKGDRAQFEGKEQRQHERTNEHHETGAWPGASPLVHGDAPSDERQQHRQGVVPCPQGLQGRPEDQGGCRIDAKADPSTLARSER